MQIENSVVIITGASSGIGAATARAFCREGAKVVLASRNSLALEQIQSQLPPQMCTSVPCDVTDPADVKLLAGITKQRFGRIDLLINNAGRGFSSTISEMKRDDLKSIIELNTIAPLLCMQSVIPYMLTQGSGVIMNVSTMATKLCAPGSGGYIASKLALDALTNTARLELKHKNIKLISVYPGLTKTNFSFNRLDAQMCQTEQSKPLRGKSPEFVAQKILIGAKKEPKYIYMGLKSRVLGQIAINFPTLSYHLNSFRK